MTITLILILFQNQEEVLNLFCTLLSQVVQLPPQPNSLKGRLQEKGNILSDRYAREGYKASSNVVTSYIKLKQLAIFFDQYHAKQFSLAQKVKPKFYNFSFYCRYIFLDFKRPPDNTTPTSRSRRTCKVFQKVKR
jgi:hypothetical protein